MIVSFRWIPLFSLKSSVKSLWLIEFQKRVSTFYWVQIICLICHYVFILKYSDDHDDTRLKVCAIFILVHYNWFPSHWCKTSIVHFWNWNWSLNSIPNHVPFNLLQCTKAMFHVCNMFCCLFFSNRFQQCLPVHLSNLPDHFLGSTWKRWQQSMQG